MDLFQRIIEQLADDIEAIIHSNGLWALNSRNPLQKSIVGSSCGSFIKKSFRAFRLSFKPKISITDDRIDSSSMSSIDSATISKGASRSLYFCLALIRQLLPSTDTDSWKYSSLD